MTAQVDRDICHKMNCKHYITNPEKGDMYINGCNLGRWVFGSISNRLHKEVPIPNKCPYKSIQLLRSKNELNKGIICQ